jgi:hypothetical protein
MAICAVTCSNPNLIHQQLHDTNSCINNFGKKVVPLISTKSKVSSDVGELYTFLVVVAVSVP